MNTTLIVIIVIIIGIVYLSGQSAKYAYKRKANQAAAFQNYLKTTDPKTQMMHASIALVAFYLFSQHKKTQLEEKKLNQQSLIYKEGIQPEKVITNPKMELKKAKHKLNELDENKELEKTTQ